MFSLQQSQTSLLSEPEAHPLLPPETAASLGSVLVVAPHPDDESLGCGGLLALLSHSGNGVHVLVMTDGSRSHPNSISHPAARLAALREKETLDALAALGLPANCVRFLRHPDCGLPLAGTVPFERAVLDLREAFQALAPEMILLPWRRDPHCDHEGTWALAHEAVTKLSKQPRWLEYPVWSWTKPQSEVAPEAREGLTAWRLDISQVLDRKKLAIAQHRSQLGAVIQDDPTGFHLKREMLAHFERPWELYLEPDHV